MRAEGALKRLGLLLLLFLGTAADPVVPEPAGYWTGPMHGAVPATIIDGRLTFVGVPSRESAEKALQLKMRPREG